MLQWQCHSTSCLQCFFLSLLNIWDQSLLKMKIHFWKTLYLLDTKNMIKVGSALRNAFFFSVSECIAWTGNLSYLFRDDCEWFHKLIYIILEWRWVREAKGRNGTTVTLFVEFDTLNLVIKQCMSLKVFLCERRNFKVIGSIQQSLDLDITPLTQSDPFSISYKLVELVDINRDGIKLDFTLDNLTCLGFTIDCSFLFSCMIPRPDTPEMC